MTKMQTWAGSNVIARLSYCHCEAFSTVIASLLFIVIASPRSGRGNLGGARLCSLSQDCFVAIAPRNDREGGLCEPKAWQSDTVEIV